MTIWYVVLMVSVIGLIMMINQKIKKCMYCRIRYEKDPYIICTALGFCSEECWDAWLEEYDPENT